MSSESNRALNTVRSLLVFAVLSSLPLSIQSSSVSPPSSGQPLSSPARSPASSSDRTISFERANSIYSHSHSIDHDSSHCNHKYPEPHEVNHVHLEPEHVLSKRSADSSLRIKIHYDDSVQDLPPEKFEVINNTILPQAISYWESALFVRPLNVPIKLTRRCNNNQAFYPENSNYRHQYCKNRCAKLTTCGEVVVPKEHLDVCRICNSKGKNCTIERGTSSGKGIEDADFVLYISALQTDRCNKTKSSTVAYAAHCQQESAMDRPIAGHINLCLDSISTKTQDLETLLSTIKHELLHTLAFSVSLYAYFRKPDGSPLIERNSNGRFRGNQPMSEHLFDERIIKKVVRSNWAVREGRIKKEVYMIVTPRVVEEVRKHFNCSTLEGAELEDQGSDGTLLTHLEKRVFENEAMTGTHTQNPIYSRITFALIEDTGWYMPNYNLAQPLKWGKNLGCDFVKKSCKDWIDSKRRKQESIHPFCEKVKKDPLETECTDDRSAVALCNLKRFNYELPSIYQNFDKIPDVNGSELGMYGGSVSLADYCPYKQEFTWKFNDVIIRGSQCQFPENSPAADKNFALEYYGEGSKCFNHNKKMWEERTCEHLRQWQHYGSGCYNYLCKDGRLHLTLLNQTYTCYSRNQEIKIQRYSNGWLHIGTIVCPPCKEICSSTGMKCKQEVVKPSPIFEKSYFKDTLKCCSLRPTSFNVLVALMVVALGVLNRRQVQWVT